MIRDKIKKYPMRAHGITTDSRRANLLGGMHYFTRMDTNYRTQILICITIQEFGSNSSVLYHSGGLSC